MKLLGVQRRRIGRRKKKVASHDGVFDGSKYWRKMQIASRCETIENACHLRPGVPARCFRFRPTSVTIPSLHAKFQKDNSTRMNRSNFRLRSFFVKRRELATETNFIRRNICSIDPILSEALTREGVLTRVNHYHQPSLAENHVKRSRVASSFTRHCQYS